MVARSQPSIQPPVVIETERLILRHFSAADVEAIFAVIGDPETMKYYPRTFSCDDAGHWVTKNQERYRNDGCGLFAVILKSTGEVIGDCGLVRQKVEGESVLEVGYHLRRDQWGHGYATEAARRLHDLCLRHIARGENRVPYPGREPAFPACGGEKRNEGRAPGDVSWIAAPDVCNNARGQWPSVRSRART